MCTLASENPNLAAEWDYINNEGLTPDDVSPRSSQVKVWWKCAHGHSWQATVKNRANGTGCPFCSGRAAIKGINDLATVNPGLASEWDYYRNADITPDMIKAKSSRKVWWKCPHGHIWQSTVWNRTKGSGCPYCSGRDAIKGINDLATVNPALALEWDYDRNPGIMPETVKPMSSLKVWWICKEGHSWLADIADRSCGYGCPYCSGRIVLPGINDLATKNPLLAAEWDYERNGDLRPDQVKSGSALKVWWRCGKGHVWQAVIYSRNYGSGCPYCANQAILPGYNDLAALNPELASEWDYEMNYPQHPSSVGLNSRSKVWWRCRYGHEWQAATADRNRGAGCPVCAGKLIVGGINDLVTRFPEVAAQWDFEKNGALYPDSVAPYSHLKIWWRCGKGHSWLTSLSNRANGNNCPYCSGMAVLPGYNDLATANPLLAAEWDLEKNGDLMPETVTASSGRLAWWRCAHGHSWHAVISHRQRGNGCPYCFGKKVLQGYNDIPTTHPQIAAEWDYDKNEDLKPDEFYIGSTARAWWRCVNGHSWNAQIRTRKKHGCPYCAGNLCETGVNDLRSLRPDIAAEWDYDRNGDLLPENISEFSGRKVWWKCQNGHNWQTTVASRSSGSGCPYCSVRLTITGLNDLCTVAPQIALEWDYSRNGELRPDSMSLFSRIKAWWKCERGHSWCVSPFARSQGSGCPYCAGKRPPKLRLLT